MWLQIHWTNPNQEEMDQCLFLFISGWVILKRKEKSKAEWKESHLTISTCDARCFVLLNASARACRMAWWGTSSFFRPGVLFSNQVAERKLENGKICTHYWTFQLLGQTRLTTMEIFVVPFISLHLQHQLFTLHKHLKMTKCEINDERTLPNLGAKKKSYHRTNSSCFHRIYFAGFIL